MEVEQIERVRDFNRYYTQRLGVLTDRHLGPARLLTEIADHGSLDTDHVTRQLGELHDRGLITIDGRTAALTDAGRRECAILDQRATAGIAALLGELTAGQRDRLVAAQDEIRRVLRAAAVTVEPVPPASPAARACLQRYAGELDALFPEGFTTGTLTRPEDVTGTQLLALEDGHPVGCGMWIRLGPGVAEVRHLWVAAEARGLGLGRKLLSRLEVDAANHGISIIRLGTHPLLTEALALYRTSGYADIGNYSDVPYNQLAFEKVLVSLGAAPVTSRPDGTRRPPVASAFRRGAVESAPRRPPP